MTTSPATPSDARGSTTIQPAVVSRIAEQAASEVRGVGSDGGGVLGLGARRDFGARPTAQAEVYGATVVLRLTVGLRYPVALAPALRTLRDHVASRVEQLTGLEVGRTEVDVTWLHASPSGGRILR